MSVAGQTPTVARILAYIEANPGTTSAPIADALGIARRDVARRLSDAMARGLVTRTGTGPSGYLYRVTRSGQERAAGGATPATDVAALPARAAEIVRDEPWSTTSEIAEALGVDASRADQALRTASRRGQIVGETRMHRGRIVKVWRAVGLRVPPSLGATA